MNYQLAVFDMDGTILDTLKDLAGALNFSLAENGYPLRTLPEVRSFVENGIEMLVRRGVPAGLPEEKIQKVLADFRPYYQVHCADETAPYAGIPALLSRLRGAGVQTAVVSNKADSAVQKLAARYFPGMFDACVGERAGIAKKPAPDTVNAVLDQLQISRNHAVYIGDSEVDIETAANAGMDHIIVTWGFRDLPFLKQKGAQVLARTPEEIFSMITDHRINSEP